jgi:tRNA(Met) cytidine acetyltransferase
LLPEELIRSEAKKADEKFYRLMAIFLGNSKNEIINFLNVVLNSSSFKRGAYAFHPWVAGAKDRYLIFKKFFDEKEIKLVDIDYSSYDNFLGETFDFLILDAVDDFRPNYISALVDSVRGGGFIILYSDTLEKDKLFKNSLIRKDRLVYNYFEERFLRHVKSHQGVFLFIDGELKHYSPPSTDAIKSPYLTENNGDGISSLCKSDDQLKALKELDFVLESGKRILALTAPRGRGKSAVVGLFLSKIMEKGGYSITITSPSYNSSSEIFNFLIKGLNFLRIKYRINKSRSGKILSIHTLNSSAKWLAPDLAKDAEGDIIVADEAAAIGLETLDYIIRKWDKIIFISTIHGYEGTGKAFLKYLQRLKEQGKFKHITLEFPIRYAKGDPIERFIYDVMLLDAEPKVKVVEGTFYEVNREELFKNEGKLRQLYGILLTAHYRNSPDDLMLLGDLYHEKVFSLDDIAVAQVIEEGGLTEGEINSILNGGGFSGHLIPYKLIKYERETEIAKHNGWRIMRIAVLPELQDKGYGSKLLENIIKTAEKEGIDWIGSSFVAEYRVINFWLKNGFIPVHLSSVKNEGLNGYSIVVLRALNRELEDVVFELSNYLKEKILRTSHQIYFNVNPLLLAKILRGIRSEQISNQIPEKYKEKIEAYLSGILEYNSVADAIHYLTSEYFRSGKYLLEEIEEAVLIGRVLQGKSWYHLSLSLNIKPRVAEEVLRGAISKLMKIF